MFKDRMKQLNNFSESEYLSNLDAARDQFNSDKAEEERELLLEDSEYDPEDDYDYNPWEDDPDEDYWDSIADEEDEDEEW